MAGSQDLQDSQNLFVWDENSQLYFHASSGFYHEPNDGWYYSSRDSLYYKFENGNYVLLHSDQRDKSEMSDIQLGVQESSFRDEKNVNNGQNATSSNFEESEANQCLGTDIDESNFGNANCIVSDSPKIPRPSSECFSNSNKLIFDGGDNEATELRAGQVDSIEPQTEGNNDDIYELEEGEWIPEDDFVETQYSDNVLNEGFSWEQENWMAQYGQVVRSSEQGESTADIPAVDLWDWSSVKGTRKHGKGEITRLVGRLMRRSAKLHPSMPCGGGHLKTAPIREVCLDLVRVTTGQIYRLRNPSAKFLASLLAYDSSNPTKDWGFPELSLHEIQQSVVAVASNLPTSNCQRLTLEKNRENKGNNTYRDRAAERRALHGGFGVAPGQKNSSVDDDEIDFPSVSTEEAVGEAMNMSFGSGSYARRILEGMGWTQGDALGKTTKGLLEPIQAQGNIGSAGLGWPRGRSKMR